MKNLAKRGKEKQIRNIKLTIGKWFHIEAESIPESSLTKLIIAIIAVLIIAGVVRIVFAILGFDKIASELKELWP